ncbi:cytidine deaminase-like protein [Hysterangium stoloniferum]|nr:cytidine deaminase-like protein [Hysterangium stoloniferum]
MSAETMIKAEVRENLIAAAIEAKKTAYVPYSKFRVGAALLTSDGEIIKGVNVENASYGACICAERTALVKAVSEGKTKFSALAVTTDVASPLSPCGICRQFIREFCSLDMPIFLAHGDWTKETNDQKVLTVTLEELLPYSFGPEDLEKPRN